MVRCQFVEEERPVISLTSVGVSCRKIVVILNVKNTLFVLRLRKHVIAAVEGLNAMVEQSLLEVNVNVIS